MQPSANTEVVTRKTLPDDIAKIVKLQKESFPWLGTGTYGTSMSLKVISKFFQKDSVWQI
jgi:hypothetical protein